MGGDVTRRRRSTRRWRLALFLFACIALLSVVAVDLSRGPAPPQPGASPGGLGSAAGGPPASWLGLNYNSHLSTGRLSDFARYGIVYDREGALEVDAGATPANTPGFKAGLDATYAARMVPDIAMDSATGAAGCDGNPNPDKTCLPTSETDVSKFVKGFTQTVSSVLHDYPGKTVLVEPLNEPWNWAFPPGTRSGQLAAAEYAAILARLLPAAKASNIPLTDIYVPATGVLKDGTSWIPDLYQARPCLKPGPTSCGPIAGWNLHPYGLPSSRTEGIGSVPEIRAQMLSGRENLIASEIGFCATDVNGGKACDVNRPDIVGTSRQTASWLAKTLKEAAAMHHAGWLKALLVWERARGVGWAMQNVDGSLTAQGKVLVLFARSSASQ